MQYESIHHIQLPRTSHFETTSSLCPTGGLGSLGSLETLSIVRQQFKNWQNTSQRSNDLQSVSVHSIYVTKATGDFTAFQFGRSKAIFTMRNHAAKIPETSAG